MRKPIKIAGEPVRRSRAKPVKKVAPVKPAKRVLKPAEDPNTLRITLYPGVAEVLQAMSVSRGVDVQTLIRVALRNLVQKSSFYGLETRLAFGKYRGETMETVVRCDPGYAAWVLKAIEGVQFSGEVLDLLEEIQTAVRGE